MIDGFNDLEILYQKLIIGGIYILLLIILLIVAFKTDKLTKKAVLTGKRNLIKISIGQFAIVVLMYLLFAVISSVFPITALITISLVSIVISALWILIAESIVGLSLKEKKEKIRIQTLLVLFQEHYSEPWKTKILPTFGLFLLLFWVGGLILFFIFPIYGTEIKVLSAIITFILPLIISYLLQIHTALQFITSPRLDDDLRNDSITQGLPGALIASIWLCIPILSIPGLIPTKYSGNSSYLIILIPFFLFSIFRIIPYFIGVQNHKNYLKNTVLKRKQVLESLLLHLSLPNPKERSEMIQSDIDSLKSEVENLTENNNTLKIYGVIKNTNVDQLNEMDEDEIESIKVIKNNYHRLSEWDLSIHHLSKLKEIQDSIISSPNEKIENYLKINLEQTEKELERVTKTKNFYLGLLISIIVAVISILLKYAEGLIPKIS